MVVGLVAVRMMIEVIRMVRVGVGRDEGRWRHMEVVHLNHPSYFLRNEGSPFNVHCCTLFSMVDSRESPYSLYFKERKIESSSYKRWGKAPLI